MPSDFEQIVASGRPASKHLSTGSQRVCGENHIWFLEADISKPRPEGDKEVVMWRRGIGAKVTSRWGEGHMLLSGSF